MEALVKFVGIHLEQYDIRGWCPLGGGSSRCLSSNPQLSSRRRRSSTFGGTELGRPGSTPHPAKTARDAGAEFFPVRLFV